MKNAWSASGNTYFQTETTNFKNQLPVGLFKTMITSQGQIYLEHIGDAFQFPYKVYGTHQQFIDWILKTYANTNGNLGILMNGIKGTGKSVALQQLSNALQLPTIIVNRNLPGLVDLLAGIQQDVTVVFDEFEKIFIEEGGRSDASPLLTIMDGVLKSEYRKVFLCTTNQIKVNDNLLQRPGRIRYLKSFGNLTPEQIAEIVDDKLVHKELRDQVIKSIAQLQIITVDIVCAVVQEVNIHSALPEEFLPFFNIKKNEPTYDIYRTPVVDGVKGEEKVYKYSTKPYYPYNEDNLAEGNNFYVKHINMGEITEVSEDLSTVKVKQYAGDDSNDNEIYEHYIYRIEMIEGYNAAYAGYNF